MTQFSTFRCDNSMGRGSSDYTIDHWSPPSSPTDESPSSSPPSNNDENNFSSNYFRSQQQPYAQAPYGRNRIGSDATQYKSSTSKFSTSAPTRNFSTGNRNYTASGQSHHQTFMEQVKALGPFQPGMKEIPIWLKSLRLHKYTPMFQPMAYAEMMSLDEASLEARQVTKGARKKILQSIAKLRERVFNIKQLEKTIDDNGDPRCLIVELRAVMNTPIAKFPIETTGIPVENDETRNEEVNDENLPGHIVRVLFRLHNHLFGNTKNRLDLEDEYILKLIQTYDKVLNSDSFTSNQKQQISTFKRILRRLAIDREILPYNSERRHTFSSNFKPQMQRPRRKSMNSLNFSAQNIPDNRSPPNSNTPTPPPPPPTYYNTNSRHHSFSYNKYTPPNSQQISPKSDQCPPNTRPAPWLRAPHQNQASPHVSPPHTPPGFSSHQRMSPPQNNNNSPTSQQQQAEFTYLVQNNPNSGTPPQLNNFYLPYLGDTTNLQAFFSALSNPQVLEFLQSLSNKPSQQESQRQMVSQGIQTLTPEIRMEPPNYSNHIHNPTAVNFAQQAVSNLADQLQLSYDEKQKFIQTVLSEDLSYRSPAESGSKLPALNQLHQKSGFQTSQSAFKPIQIATQKSNNWWTQTTDSPKFTGNSKQENSNAGPSLMIPPISYLNAHHEFVDKLWEPLPGTPPVLNPCTPQIDSKPVFVASPTVQYRTPQPPIGTGANRAAAANNHHHQPGNSNVPPFDFSSLLVSSPLRM